MKDTKPQKTYRVQYWLGAGKTHGSSYYDDFNEALLQYINWLTVQVLEIKYVKKIVFEELGSDGAYYVIFTAECSHPFEN